MLLLFEVEALEEQLNEQEEEAQKAEASLAKHKSDLAIEQRKNAELEAIVQSPAEELSDAQCRIEELITQAAGLEELEKDSEIQALQARVAELEASQAKSDEDYCLLHDPTIFANTAFCSGTLLLTNVTWVKSAVIRQATNQNNNAFMLMQCVFIIMQTKPLN